MSRFMAYKCSLSDVHISRWIFVLLNEFSLILARLIGSKLEKKKKNGGEV